jgi:hypothetical protein
MIGVLLRHKPAPSLQRITGRSQRDFESISNLLGNRDTLAYNNDYYCNLGVPLLNHSASEQIADLYVIVDLLMGCGP